MTKLPNLLIVCYTKLPNSWLSYLVNLVDAFVLLLETPLLCINHERILNNLKIIFHFFLDDISSSSLICQNIDFI